MVHQSLNFDLTPLAWEEMYRHDDEWSIKSKKELLKHLREKENCRDWIENNIDSDNIFEKYGPRIRDLLVGYCLLDLADWARQIKFEKRKMWMLFEDLIYEVFRDVLKKKSNCNIIRVDKSPGFQGLDFIIINQKDEDWNVGIQCKRYIATGMPHSKIDKYGPYSKNVSAAVLLKKSFALRQKFGSKKLILTAFDVYYYNQQQFRRFQKLKSESQWNKILVFNKPQKPYKHKLNCVGLDTVIGWC